ncbi:hypothetical protein [Pacificibacter sp. AS14]
MRIFPAYDGGVLHFYGTIALEQANKTDSKTPKIAQFLAPQTEQS